MRSAILFGAILFAVAAAGFVGSPSARADDRVVQVAIDMDTTGNSFDSLGPSEDCNTTALSVGDTIDVDVVVRDVPEYEPAPTVNESPHGGLAGLDLDVVFDPAVVWVKRVQEETPTLWAPVESELVFWVLDYHTPGAPDGPGSTGRVSVGAGDLSSNYESGDGILLRLTLQAVGTGSSTISVVYKLIDQDFPNVYASDTSPYAIENSPAVIDVSSGVCAPLPTPSPSAAPSVTPSMTATVTPKTFPPSGGRPASSEPLAAIAIALGVVALGVGFWLARRGLG